jgi:N utilization substance protein B
MIEKRPKNKTVTRLAAVQALYLYDIDNIKADSAVEDVIDYYLSLNPLEDYGISDEDQINLIDKKFLNKIFQKTIESLAAIDLQITNLTTKQQEMSRLSSVLRAILRVGACELLFFPTPYKVVIDEYVTLANEFYSAAEVNFINGMLDKIANQVLRSE